MFRLPPDSLNREQGDTKNMIHKQQTHQCQQHPPQGLPLPGGQLFRLIIPPVPAGQFQTDLLVKCLKAQYDVCILRERRT